MQPAQQRDASKLGGAIEDVLSSQVGKLGPAMLALNDRQRRFVVACLELGCTNNYTRAAQLAGYEGGRNTLRVTAHRLAHDERISAAILEEARKRLQSATIAATSFITGLIRDEKARDADRLKAAELILNRTGLHEVREHVVTDHRSRDEKLREIVRWARSYGFDPRAYLGSLADVVEADFRVIEEVEKEPSSGGQANAQ